MNEQQQQQAPNYVVDTETICNYLKDQLGSFKELMEEKFERVFTNQDGLSKRLDSKGEEIDVLTTHVSDLRESKADKEKLEEANKEIAMLKEAKKELEGSFKATKFWGIVVALLLGIAEVIIIFFK